MDHIRGGVAFERAVEMLARAVDDNGTAAREPRIELDADAVAQPVARPFERKETERRPQLEFFGRKRNVLLAIAARPRDVTMRKQDRFTLHAITRKAEHRVLTRARRSHHIDQTAARCFSTARF